MFGQRIKQLRQELKFSQRDFSEKIGVTASALSAYEKGMKNPSVNVAINIAMTFNVSLDWLCGLTKEANKFKPDSIIPFDLPHALNLAEAYAVQEVRQILAALDKEPLKWRAFLRLLIDTGIRRGECSGIKWENVNFRDNSITIAGNLCYTPQKGVYLDTPKNGSSRTVDVDPEIMACPPCGKNKPSSLLAPMSSPRTTARSPCTRSPQPAI